MCLAEGTPSADGTQAFSRVGHSRGDFQPFTSFWQPDPASCSVHQPANASTISQHVLALQQQWTAQASCPRFTPHCKMSGADAEVSWRGHQCKGQ